MAKQSQHAPVYAYSMELSDAQSPLMGSGHGLDMALLFQPTAHCATLSPEQKAGACEAFFGRPALGGDSAAGSEGAQQLADGFREAIVRFVRSGAPGHLNGVEWSPTSAEHPVHMVAGVTPKMCKPAPSKPSSSC